MLYKVSFLFKPILQNFNKFSLNETDLYIGLILDEYNSIGLMYYAKSMKMNMSILNYLFKNEMIIIGILID